MLSQHALQVVSEHALQQVSGGGAAPGGDCSRWGLLPGGSAPWGVCPLGGLLPGGSALRVGGAWWRPPVTATAADGTHPAGMHSCFGEFSKNMREISLIPQCISVKYSWAVA